MGAETKVKAPATELTLTGTQAETVMKAARIMSTFASTDVARSVLQCVRWSFHGGVLCLEATDSYRLARIRMNGFDGAADMLALIPGVWIRRQFPTKRSSIAEEFCFGVDHDRFTFVNTQTSETASVAIADGHPFPDTSTLWDASAEAVLSDEVAGFNAKLLRSIFDAAAKWGGLDAPIRCTRFEYMTPSRFEVKSADGDLDMLIMPVRLPDIDQAKARAMTT